MQAIAQDVGKHWLKCLFQVGFQDVTLFKPCSKKPVFEGFEAGIFGIGIGSFWRRIGIGLTGNFQNFLLEQKFSEFFAG